MQKTETCGILEEEDHPKKHTLEDEEEEECEHSSADEDDAPHLRSVMDFDSPEDLRQALQVACGGKRRSFTNSSVMVGCFSGDDSPCLQPNPMCPVDDPNDLDWVLMNYNETTTEAQSMQDELRRLLVLKSYLVLDSEKEDAFDRLTAIGSRVFDAPICLVSLVDIGRQWFKSNRGLGPCQQTDRRSAFCAHAIQLKPGIRILLVPDATKDFRFKNNPLVLGAPHIRFYAGAPLIAPEGFKLGTFCVISPVARPRGLSISEEETLIDLAAMTVKTLVDRRAQVESSEDPARLIAYTSHDLMTPLSGVQLALSLLSDDEGVQQKLEPHQLDLLATATNCSEIMTRICQSSIQGLRTTNNRSQRGLFDVELSTKRDSDRKVTCVIDLVKSLNLLLEPIPKRIPLVITLSPSVPDFILSDDLKLFRSALNLVSDALERTERGKVHLTIKAECPTDSVVKGKRSLVFECEDFAPNFSTSQVPYLFKTNPENSSVNRLGLQSVANLVRSLGGTCGHRARHENEAGSVLTCAMPLLVPSSDKGDSSKSLTASLRSHSNLGSMSHISPPQHTPEQISTSSHADRGILGNASSTELDTTKHGADRRVKHALVIEDSAVVRKMIVRALVKLGFEVEQAEDGQEGLLSMKTSMFDMVLCDFLMPVMDGLDCVKQYREWEGTNHQSFRQYIVGISAHVSVEDSSQGTEAGMNDFRPKPISIKTLRDLQKSEMALATSRWLDENTGFESSCSPETRAKPLEAPSLLRERPAFPDRRKLSRMQSQGSKTHILFIMDDTSQEDSVGLVRDLQAKGWDVQFAYTAGSAIGMLKKRNWHAVVVDADRLTFPLPRLMSDFRQWESSNRVNEQKNVIYIAGCKLPRREDMNSVIQVPLGFNFVLGKPYSVTDLCHCLDEGKTSLSILVPGRS